MNTKNVKKISQQTSDSCDLIISKNEQLQEIIEGDFFDDIDELNDSNIAQKLDKINEIVSVIIGECKNLYNIVKNEIK